MLMSFIQSKAVQVAAESMATRPLADEWHLDEMVVASRKDVLAVACR